jgi:hypothetical protein
MPGLAGRSYRTRRLLVRALRRPPGRRRRWVVLLAGVLLIAAWQRGFFAHREDLDTRYGVRESMGMNHEWRFLYFLYYTGLYPVVSMEGHVRMMGEPGYKRFSPEAARRVLAERGETLWMEWDYTIRAGDMGRALLYLPYAIWSGSAREPRLAPTHAVAFTLALIALFGAFWWVRDPVLGAASVALLGSNPFQLQVVHAQENVFGWTLTTAIFALALAVPIFWRRPGRFGWVLAALTGVLLATVRQIRPEPVTMFASAAAACLVFAPASWRRRLVLTAALGAAFVGAGMAWRAYFDHKFEEARAVVAAAGGTVYSGPRELHHGFWHPFWCGLGDFDDKYGYAWSDQAARHYATPIVRERYAARGLPPPDDRVLQWEPAYNEVLKEKVLHDIRSDPAWYLGILVRRVGRVLTWTTPVRLSFGGGWVTLPWNGPATVLLVVLLAASGSWRLLQAVVFPLGTSLTAVLVFSGTVPGQTYTGWFHVVGAAIVLAGVVSVVAEWRRLRSRPG